MSDLLHQVPCGIVSLSADGTVSMVNDTLLTLLGLRREDVLGRPFHSLLSKGGRIFYQTHLFPLLRMRGMAEEIYLSFLTADGDEVPMLINVRARVDEAGATVHDVVLVRVRQRAQFENALLAEKKKVQQASKAKDDFLAALSHELRTPLNPMLMLSSEMELDETLPAAARAQASIIRANAELEARLIDDLLDLTRIVNGKLHLVDSLVDMHDLLVLTEDISRSESQTKRVALRVDMQATEYHLRCDAARMQQIFWNLVKNAIKFTPEGGDVCITTRNPVPGRISITVADTGIGIPAETLPHIFDAFEQGSIAKQQFGGLGLGLAISKSIVQMHGGSIVGESAGLEQGACFTVEFATCAPPPPKVPSAHDAGTGPAAAAGSSPATVPLRLLLVEDHDSTREVLTRILRRSGHEVHAAASAAEALVLADSVTGMDALISDIGLPDQSGLELMRQLRERQHHFPAIALSGYGMEQDLKNAHAAGFSAHLVKPVSLHQLRLLLGQVAAGSLG